MCVYHEEPQMISETLASLQQQNVVMEYPEAFEFVIIGTDGDSTFVAEEWEPCATVLSAPRGKLNARHLGALETGADIILSVDADSFYPRNWANKMLEPLGENVGTTASAIDAPFEPLMYFMKLLEYRGRMLGRGCAYWRRAYFDSGAFDLSVDQRDIRTLNREEEWDWRTRLNEIGRVSFQDVPMLHRGAWYGHGTHLPRGKGYYRFETQ